MALEPGSDKTRADESSPRAQAIVFVVYFGAMRFLFPEVHGLLADSYVPAALVMAAVAVWGFGFYNRWLFWRTRPEKAPKASFFETLAAVLGLVVTFTVVTSFLVGQGWLHASGWRSGLPGKWHLVAGIERDFLWNFLDAIPGLDLPSTLNWRHPAHALTGYSGGSVLLIFKVLVILPVISLVVELIKHAQQKDDSAFERGG